MAHLWLHFDIAANVNSWLVLKDPVINTRLLKLRFKDLRIRFKMGGFLVVSVMLMKEVASSSFVLANTME